MNQTVRQTKGRNIQRLILYAIIYLAAGSVFLLPLTMPILRSTSDFSIYNTGWRGCSQLAIDLYLSDKQVYPLHTPFRTIQNRPEDTTTALIIIGPTRPFTDADSNYTADFAQNGGTVMVANDFDQANTLLDDLFPDTRFTNQEVIDLSYQEDPRLVKSYTLTDDQILGNITSFNLNQPSSLKGIRTDNILASSTTMSWQDTNRDGKWDREESRGPFPVMAKIPYGEGEIILLSDPSIFINQMIRQEGNQKLYTNLVDHLSGEGVTRIYIDEEHHATANPLQIFTAIIRVAPDYQRLILTWMIITVVLFVIHPRLRQTVLRIIDLIISIAFKILTLGTREPTTSQDPLKNFKEKHPDRDEKFDQIIRKYQPEEEPFR